jgi:hypothetical protein
MLKKTLLACLFLFSIISVSGQSFSDTKGTHNKEVISLKMTQSVIVIVDSVKYEIDSEKADDIKNKWIEKIVVMKDKPDKKPDGNKSGTVFIYTKKEYKNDVLKEIKNNGSRP